MKSHPIFHTIVFLLGTWSFSQSLCGSPPPEGLTSSDWHEIQRVYETGRLGVVKQPDGCHAARNPAQDWLVRFNDTGFHVEPGGAGWRWGLTLRAYGAAEDLIVAPEKPTNVQADANRIVTRWDDCLAEWFVNRREGLLQGWTFLRNPRPDADATGSLRLELAVTGDLTPRVEPGGTAITFLEASGTAAVTYGGLRAWDADGRALPVRFEALDENAGPRFAVEVDARGARYPVSIDPIAQQAYLKASNTDPSDQFGTSVAISGDTVVVGAPGEDGDGLNVVPTSSNGTNGDPTDNSKINAGAAYVFVRTGGAWVQQAYLKGVVNPLLAPASGDYFGSTVAIDGNTIVVGASALNGNRGAAFVFTRTGSVWSAEPVRLLTAESPQSNDRFADSVAISGDTIVVGARGSGSVSVFVRSGTMWNRQATLTASNPGVGDSFGTSVAISGNTIAIGAPGEDSSETGTGGSGANNDAPSSGAAYVFVRSGSTWSQQAYLKASNAESDDYFGISVAISGDTLIVGASGESSASPGVNGNQANNGADVAGAAYVFTRTGVSWSQQAYLKASNPGASDQFGDSVAISGDVAVVGAFGESSAARGIDGNQDDDTAVISGAVYVFVRKGTSWSQQAYLKSSNSDPGDNFGAAVAIDGRTLLVGSLGEDSKGTGPDANPFDDTAPTAGAAYVFVLPPPTAPVVRIRGGKVRRVTSARAVLKGTASDMDGDLARVEAKAPGSRWKRARGLEKWKFVARGLKTGRTAIRIRAVDFGGLRSRVVRLVVKRS